MEIKMAVDKLQIGENSDSLLNINTIEEKIAVSSELGTISFVNISSNSQLDLIEKTTLTKGEECPSVCFHKTSNNLFCASGTSIYLLDVRNLKEPVKNFRFNAADINQITLSACKKFLLSADDSGEIKVINIETESEEKTLKKHENVCFTLKSRCGEFSEVISGGYDCNLIRWNIENSKLLQKFNMIDFRTEFSLLACMNPPYILDLGFNKSASLLAAGLQDGSIRLWNTRKRKIKYFHAIPNAHTSLGVTQVGFVNDENLISGGNDEKLKMWKIQPGNDVFYEEKLRIDHGFKINSFSLSSYKKDCLLVCDTTSKLSLYQFN